jgi:tetratricopeptide (TPR) repeat protein
MAVMKRVMAVMKKGLLRSGLSRCLLLLGLFASGELSPYWLVSGLAVVGCHGGGRVMRKRGKTVVEGRYISSTAYAWYIRGTSALAHEHLEEAQHAFDQAIRHDPRSAAAYAGLIRASCGTSDEEFQRHVRHGVERGDRPGLVEAAAAECWRRRDKREQAVIMARAALSSEPYHPDVNRVAHSTLSWAGEVAEAERIERGYRLSTGQELFVRWESPDDPATLAQVDRALLRDHLSRARSLAMDWMSPGALAARALAWGREDFARAQALLVAQADPEDPDARIVLFLLGQQSGVPFKPAPLFLDGAPTLVSLLLVAAQLERFAAPEIAQSWLAHFALEIRDSTDPLVVEMRARFFSPQTESTPLGGTEGKRPPTSPATF